MTTTPNRELTDTKSATYADSNSKKWPDPRRLCLCFNGFGGADIRPHRRANSTTRAKAATAGSQPSDPT
ncbi:Uncharacterised protein [Vibrio cholerae]|nr:Uncharacterised protein [Vibrio cholerae]